MFSKQNLLNPRSQGKLRVQKEISSSTESFNTSHNSYLPTTNVLERVDDICVMKFSDDRAKHLENSVCGVKWLDVRRLDEREGYFSHGGVVWVF